MLSEYSDTKSESMAEICAIIAKIQIFSNGMFLLAHPVVFSYHSH